MENRVLTDSQGTKLVNVINLPAGNDEHDIVEAFRVVPGAENKGWAEKHLEVTDKIVARHPSRAACTNSECFVCGYRDCPEHEFFHYHSDGCPKGCKV